MENITSNINLKNMKVTFDLKGSTRKRLTKVPNSFWFSDLNCSKVLKDMNFKIISDQIGSRLFNLDASKSQEVLSILKADSEFLARHNLMDYSLLLVIETDRRTKEQSYYFGIIDILQKWNWSKKLENAWKVKVMRANKHKLSAIPSALYQERYIRFIQRDVLAQKVDKALSNERRAKFIESL